MLANTGVCIFTRDSSFHARMANALRQKRVLAGSDDCSTTLAMEDDSDDLAQAIRKEGSRAAESAAMAQCREASASSRLMPLLNTSSAPCSMARARTPSLSTKLAVVRATRIFVLSEHLSNMPNSACMPECFSTMFMRPSWHMDSWLSTCAQESVMGVNSSEHRLDIAPTIPCEISSLMVLRSSKFDSALTHSSFVLRSTERTMEIIISACTPPSSTTRMRVSSWRERLHRALAQQFWLISWYESASCAMMLTTPCSTIRSWTESAQDKLA
mmetsp:Transcript_6012/g.9793  ORF Transcript_6012/g.9793 Transcript_6012/m.9793 type:complete len:271 (+) Transcript_6012:851-1663(+)